MKSLQKPSDIIKRGAEAVISLSKWRGRTVVVKERAARAYRLPAIDTKLRNERMKAEAGLFLVARRAGVSVPIIYELDMDCNRIIMEFIGGRTVKETINDGSIPRKEKAVICAQIGKTVGKLHGADISHGDLTTSNMILDGSRICLIDFSMGSKNADIEKKGVDFHLLKEAFQSAHSENFRLFREIKKGYLGEYGDGSAVIKRMEEIEERGRYSRSS
jgi:Kae1-associated kinase Bud32